MKEYELRNFLVALIQSVTLAFVMYSLLFPFFLIFINPFIFGLFTGEHLFDFRFSLDFHFLISMAASTTLWLIFGNIRKFAFRFLLWVIRKRFLLYLGVLPPVLLFIEFSSGGINWPIRILIFGYYFLTAAHMYTGLWFSFLFFSQPIQMLFTSLTWFVGWYT